LYLRDEGVSKVRFLSHPELVSGSYIADYQNTKILKYPPAGRQEFRMTVFLTFKTPSPVREL